MFREERKITGTYYIIVVLIIGLDGNKVPLIISLKIIVISLRSSIGQERSVWY